MGITSAIDAAQLGPCAVKIGTQRLDDHYDTHARARVPKGAPRITPNFQMNTCGDGCGGLLQLFHNLAG